MIVILDEALFCDDTTDDVSLVAVLCQGRGRYKVRTRPAYRPDANAGINRWLCEQGLRIRKRVHTVLEEGLKAPEYALIAGAREPRVIVENRSAPEWPDTFDKGPAKLPLPLAEDLVLRPLRLLLENGRNDWAFLAKIVPPTWRAKWDLAVQKRWLEEQNSGGITEMRRIIEEQLAADPVRRLRTWAMFDSDGHHDGDASDDSEKTHRACENWGVAFHRLRRRAIENYIPKETLYDWAARRHHMTDRKKMVAHVKEYCELRDEERHYYDMKAGFHRALAQHVWADDEKDRHGNPVVYDVSDDSLVRDRFGGSHEDGRLREREELFQSLFSRL